MALDPCSEFAGFQPPEPSEEGRPGLRTGWALIQRSTAARFQIRPAESSASGAGKSAYAREIWSARCGETPNILAISLMPTRWCVIWGRPYRLTVDGAKDKGVYLLSISIDGPGVR